MSTVLEATYSLQPQISVGYDQAKGIYTGTVMLHGQTYSFSGPSSDFVNKEIETTITEEYDRLARSIEQDRPLGRSVSMGGSSSSHDHHHTLSPIIDEDRGRAHESHHKPLAPTLSAVWDGIEMGHTIHMLMSANLFDLLATTLLCLGVKKLAFAAFLDNEKVVASSPRKLRKLLERKKNRKIFEIMSIVEELRQEQDRIKKLNHNLKRKKAIAPELFKNCWAERLSRNLESGDWRDRIDAMRMELNDFRSRSQDLFG